MAGKKGQGEAWRANNLKVRALIADEEAFRAKADHLVGYYVDGMLEDDAYGLSGDDLERFLRDAPFIVYVVMSYDTPIYWTTEVDGSYTIANPPSKTTAGHRNLCPGYGQTREPGWTYPRNPDGTRRRVRKEDA